jgi:hypothetical protein
MKNNSTPSEGWEKEIKNYECREYDGIKWIRYDHYLDALSSQLKEVLGVIESKKIQPEYVGRDDVDISYFVNFALDKVKAELSQLAEGEDG